MGMCFELHGARDTDGVPLQVFIYAASNGAKVIAIRRELVAGRVLPCNVYEDIAQDARDFIESVWPRVEFRRGTLMA